mgnify:CR=1 FL=1
MLPKSESNDSQKPNYTVLEKSNAQGISPSDNLLKTSIKSDTETSSTSPTHVAWCSDENNEIRIVELEKKQKFSDFDGVKITLTCNSAYF